MIVAWALFMLSQKYHNLMPRTYLEIWNILRYCFVLQRHRNTCINFQKIHCHVSENHHKRNFSETFFWQRASHCTWVKLYFIKNPFCWDLDFHKIFDVCFSSVFFLFLTNINKLYHICRVKISKNYQNF